MIRALCATALMLAPLAVHADAAIKAQEGEINHWIEYYEKQRAPTTGTVAGEEREKRKEERKSPAPQGRTGPEQEER